MISGPARHRSLEIPVRLRDLRMFAVATLAVSACHHESPVIIDRFPHPSPANEPEVVAALANGLRDLDVDEIASLLHPNFRATIDQPPDGTVSIDRIEFLKLLSRWVGPSDSQLVRLDVSLACEPPFREDPAWYRSPSNPDGLDPALWYAAGTDCGTSFLLQTVSDQNFQITHAARLVVVNDLTRPTRASGKFLLYQWEGCALLLLPRLQVPIADVSRQLSRRFLVQEQ
jgi:hypothetical protein